MKPNSNNKRIALVLSTHAFTPHSGVGISVKSFIETFTPLGFVVDVILDKEPEPHVLTDWVKTHSKLIYSSNPQSYAHHKGIFRYGDGYCYERMINLRNSVLLALQTHIYDTIICNTFESVAVVNNLDIAQYVQVIAYTHLDGQLGNNNAAGPMMESTNVAMFNSLMDKSIVIGTQSEYTLQRIKTRLEAFNVHVLPLPFPEPEMLSESVLERSGVLYIGRWEPNKNPQMFVDLIKQTNLPAKILTNAVGAKKFKSELAGYDVTIGVDLIGKEKCDFITSSRVAFNPSKVETYGLAFWEQSTHMPTVVYKNPAWLKNFPYSKYYTATKKTMADVVICMYLTYSTAESWYKHKTVANITEYNQTVPDYWLRVFEQFKPKTSNLNTAAICHETDVNYSDYMASLGRIVICLDDIKSVLTNRSKFVISQTRETTHLTAINHV